MYHMKIALACTVCGSRNYQIMSEHKERLTLKKFCKKCNRHTTHKSSI
ncbi:50S ribosomal protein L33 [Salinicoccus kekensis]|uniref:Large ribosomal subunit protein bL33 n=1 Tax=Salinicoccus kekensis TaxID=714307 RepID=A0A285UME8_9STAP|nr:50S ribosomal protein L33 [Salinicoccus kekensis]SOC43094.1 LSU ribosomal protein L33P [Salinicoccus kekensis]